MPPACIVLCQETQTCGTSLLVDRLSCLKQFIPCLWEQRNAIFIHQPGFLKQRPVAHYAKRIAITRNTVYTAVLIGKQLTDRRIHCIQPSSLFELVCDICNRFLFDQLLRLCEPGFKDSRYSTCFYHRHKGIRRIFVVSRYIGNVRTNLFHLLQKTFVHRDLICQSILRPDAQRNRNLLRCSGYHAGHHRRCQCCSQKSNKLPLHNIFLPFLLFCF